MRGMTERALYLAAYDVADPRRLRRALGVVKGYATGGQKSAYECFLTPSECRVLMEEMRAVLDLDEDRFLLVALGPAAGAKTLGIASPPADPDVYVVA